MAAATAMLGSSVVKKNQSMNHKEKLPLKQKQLLKRQKKNPQNNACFLSSLHCHSIEWWMFDTTEKGLWGEKI